MNYPRVITVADDAHTLFSIGDFGDLVREQMGDDAAQFFYEVTDGKDEQIQDLEDELDALAEKVEELKNQLRYTEMKYE